MKLSPIIVIVLLLCALTGCQHRSGSSASHGAKATRTIACPIDGVATTEAKIDRRPIAVMVENSPAARPQSGLTQADVVYEAITEGGITRFLAVYLHADPATIGPVRSARPHFINLAREYQAAYVHCGESYEALQILTEDPTIFNLDQMKYGKPFWRDHTRKAPHNLYTSSEKLRAEMKKLDWEWPVGSLPSFSGAQPFNSTQAATSVDLHFGGAVKYNLRLVYDAKRKGYLRYMDGKLHVDRETGVPVVVKNVLIQRVQSMPYPGSTHGTQDVDVLGTGDGIYISRGRQMNVLWRKDSISSITAFTDIDGNPVPFESGQTWVELVPQEGTVTVATPPPS